MHYEKIWEIVIILSRKTITRNKSNELGIYSLEIIVSSIVNFRTNYSFQSNTI